MSAYSSAVLADAPVHYWRCADPGGGLGHDIGSSPKHIHGLGSPISTPFGYSGPISDGGSMDLALDGVFANPGNSIPISRNPITMECLYWNWQQLSTAGILMKAGLDNLCTLFNTGAAWEFLYNGVALTSVHNYTAQVWHHIVATYDGTNARLYIDALLAGPSAATAVGTVTSTFEIGTSDGTAAWGHGFFAELAVYNTALSPTRVNAHFLAIDNSINVPVFSSSNGSPGGLLPTLNQILSAVQRTFPATS